MSQNEIVIRPAGVEDAGAVNQLHLERFGDMLPHKPGFEQVESLILSEGEADWRDWIEAAEAEPSRSFVGVATSSEAVVGYCYAEISPDQHLTWWKGITVARNHEGRGVGQRLEAARQIWALQVVRPIGVLVAVGNERSKTFFQKQGFELRGTFSVDEIMQVSFNVMKLPYVELQRRHG